MDKTGMLFKNAIDLISRVLSAKPDRPENARAVYEVRLLLMSDGRLRVQHGDSDTRLRPGDGYSAEVNGHEAFLLEYRGWLEPPAWCDVNQRK